MELEELNTISNELSRINQNQEKRVQFYETKAQTLTLVYIIFQGMILMSVSSFQSSSSNQCKRWWVFFTVSFLSSFIFFMAFVDAVKNYYYTKYYLDMNYIEQQFINKRIHESRSSSPTRNHHMVSIRIGSSSSLNHDGHGHDHDKIIKPDAIQLFKRKLCIVVMTSALLGFTAVVLFSCRVFLCDVGETQPVVTSALSP